jgi:hypothetical protein
MAITSAILLLLCVGLYLALATELVRKYLRTRDIGFAWLGVAVVVWPQLSGLLTYGQGLLITRVAGGRFTIGELVIIATYARQVIGLVLLLAAVFFLSKAKPAALPLDSSALPSSAN